MRPFHTLSIALALLSFLPVPSDAQNNPLPVRARHITALDVRRACLNPNAAADRVMKSICDLRLPETRQRMRDPSCWLCWSDLFADPSIRPDTLILHYADALDEEAVRAADVLDLLDVGERAAILTRLGKDATRLRRDLVSLLQPNESAKLVRALFALRGESATSAMDTTSRSVADTVAGKLETAITAEVTAASNTMRGALANEALDKVLRDQLQQLETRELLALISSQPDIEKRVLSHLLGSSTVADLVRLAPGSASVRLATMTRQQLAGTPHDLTIRGGSLSSNAAWGVSDFVVGRVEQQLRTYAVRGLANRVCKEIGEVLLHESCQVLRSSQFGMSSSGANMLRGAVRRDLDRMPITALGWTYEKHSAHMDDASRDRLQVAIRGAGFALQVSRGADPWLALTAVGDSLVPGRRSALQSELDRLRAELNAAERALAQAAALPDSARKLRQRVSNLNSRLRERARLIVPLSLSVEAFPISSTIADLSALYATRFDRLRVRPAIWAEDTGRSLLRAQLVAMLANARSDAGVTGQATYSRLWRFAPVALAVDEELGRIQELRRQLESLRKEANADTARLQEVRVALAGAAFNALERLLAEVPRTEVVEAQRAIAVTQAVVMPLVEGDYGAAVLGIRDQVTLLAPGLISPGSDQYWVRGLTFVSELSGAGSAEQVNAALVRLTESGQGFEAKRDGQEWRLGLNAFGGIYGGADWDGFSRERAGGETSSFGGLYLPVGLAVTTPWSVPAPWGGRLGTVGVFAQVVDLGALASWRLDEGSTVERRPEVELGHVFSPGLFAVLHVRGAPLSIGYGWSYSPDLRRAKDVSGGEDERPDGPSRFGADRRGVFIAMDIPLFP